MLKVGSCKCLLKNFQIYKSLKYVKYSSGSGNDQNDNDNFDPKNEDNKTDSTTKKSNVNDLEYIFNNLLVNKNNPKKNEAYILDSKNKDNKTESTINDNFDPKNEDNKTVSTTKTSNVNDLEYIFNNLLVNKNNPEKNEAYILDSKNKDNKTESTIKNFQIYKSLKDAKYSSGSGNDQNDNDNFDPKNEDNKTDSTTKTSNVNGLEYIFNNLLVNKNNPKKNEAYILDSKNKDNKTESTIKKVETNSNTQEKNEIASISTKSKYNIRKEMTAMEETTLKELFSKFVTKTEDVKESDTVIRMKNTGPDSRTKVMKNTGPDSRKKVKEMTASEETTLKELFSKFVTKTEDVKESDTVIRMKNTGPDSRTKVKEITASKETTLKKEMTASEETTLKELFSKFVNKTRYVNESDTYLRKKNTGPDSRTKVADRLYIDFEKFKSDMNNKKSSNSMSPENFKNLLSSCKVEITPNKKYSVDGMSISDYLKSIFDVDLIFKDNKMEGDNEPFSIAKQYTKEDFMKLISEMVVGSSTKVSFNFDPNEKSFISTSEPTMRLNIFRKINSETQAEKENSTSIIDLVESHEYRKMNSNIPTSYFHECIQLTRDKIMRNFPIDNEQDSEELNVGFHQHVFPQQYLTGKLPNTGIIGQYMNYVCMGLSQNPHLTIEQKKAHIKWFEEYLSNKQEEINLATKKIKDDFEYEISLRNK